MPLSLTDLKPLFGSAAGSYIWTHIFSFSSHLVSSIYKSGSGKISRRLKKKNMRGRHMMQDVEML